MIPDEVEVIGRNAREFSEMYNYVFTAGGVGPTHDDVTMAGIAEGFGVKIVSHPEIRRFLSAKYSSILNEAILKMTEVPEGAEVIIFKDARFPIVTFKNIYIFPGIPEYLKKKFSLLRERFRSLPFYFKKFLLKARESEIAEILNSSVKECPDVTFGSYPVTGNPEYSVVVTAESRSDTSLSNAVNSFLNKLPADKLVRVE